MKIISPSFEILTPIDADAILKHIERCGRTCYKSEAAITEDSASKFSSMIVKSGHLSVIEHFSVSVKFTVDRGVTHEMVRHRLASPSQESTRYCNYSRGKFGSELTFVDLGKHIMGLKDVNEEDKALLLQIWLCSLEFAEHQYMSMIELGAPPQIARSVLPNSLKSEIVITANLREWKLIFQQRCSSAAHPQMREMMIPLFEEFSKVLPEIFNETHS